MKPRSADELAAAFDEYVGGVLAGRRIVGQLERLAVERHVRDTRDGAARGLRFNRRQGLRVCYFVEHYVRFSKREWAGKPFILAGWQIFVLASLFGWQRQTDSGEWIRRFRVAYVSVARKNGKSELAAAIALVVMSLFSVAEGEVYSAATKRDQAALSWRAGASMARRSPQLAEHFRSIASTYTMVHQPSGTRFQAVASDANTLDGLGPLLAIVDELHAHPTRDVWDVLSSGMGATREPLMLAITTAGDNRHGVCWDLEADCIKILEGAYEDPGAGDDHFSLICRIDEKDDPFDRACWSKANPNLNVSVFPEALEAASKAAKRTPASFSEYRRKNLNDWVEKSLSWLPLTAWDECLGEFDLDALRGQRCILGLDLSATRDYTSAVLLFPQSDGRFFVVPHHWIPDETLFDRQKSDRVPVVEWVNRGLVTATTGQVVDYNAVFDWVISAADRYELLHIAVDPNRATALVTQLVDHFGEMQRSPLEPEDRVIAYPQTKQWMGPAVQATEISISTKRLVHDGNPVLRWMFSNVAMTEDHNGVQMLSKQRSADRIDGIVALVMARGLLDRQQDEYFRGEGILCG